LKSGETGKYMKGLGSYKPELLKQIIQKDKIENMMKIFEIDDKNILDDWLSDDKVETRKSMLSKNHFDITGV
jgi:hypothetical protein